MIQITRSVAQQIRALVKRGLAWTGKRPTEVLQCSIVDQVLRIAAVSETVSIVYEQSVLEENTSLIIPFSALRLCEGKSSDLVKFELTDSQHIRLSWPDSTIPQVRDLEIDPDSDIRIPVAEFTEPSRWVTHSSEFLMAIRDAVQTAEQSPTRFALNCLKLCGEKGQVVAADGNQILIQGGFKFPWTEDLLVPATLAFTCPMIVNQSKQLEIGRTDTQVLFRAGSWQIRTAINTTARYPQIDPILANRTALHSTVSLSQQDRQFLLDAIPRLPRNDDKFGSLTLELNGNIALRAKADNQSRATEIVLQTSQRSGPDIRINTNRKYLERALKMGFSSLNLYGPNIPAQCHDANRTYIWALLSPGFAIQHSEGDISIESSIVLAQSPSARRRAA